MSKHRSTATRYRTKRILKRTEQQMEEQLAIQAVQRDAALMEAMRHVPANTAVDPKVAISAAEAHSLPVLEDGAKKYLREHPFDNPLVLHS